MIRRSDDVDDLLDRILGEYERRLREMSADALNGDGPVSLQEAKKLQALVMFAGQAVALKEKAAAASEMRNRAGELERLNRELEAALEQEERLRRRLDDVLGALDSGILVVGPDGRVRHGNRAASELTGVAAEQLVGSPVEEFVGEVRHGKDGEVTREAPDGVPRTCLVSRRSMAPGREGEVVLLSDVTERDRAVEQRHRLARNAERLKTLGSLSHQINNPLTSLMGRAQILRMRRDTDPKVQKAAKVIEESARRIAEYIRELATVAREGKEEALAELLELDGRPAPEGGDGR